jgi:hypothetical protein
MSLNKNKDNNFKDEKILENEMLMALGSTQPLTEMSTRNLRGG